MTTLNLNQIPSQINSLERLAVWVGTLLSKINPVQRIPVDNASNPRCAQYSIFKDQDGQEHIYIELVIKLDPTWTSDTATKAWMKAMDISETAILASYTSN